MPSRPVWFYGKESQFSVDILRGSDKKKIGRIFCYHKGARPATT